MFNIRFFAYHSLRLVDLLGSRGRLSFALPKVFMQMSRTVHIRPRKVSRGPKRKGPQSDGGIHIDEMEGGMCQASSKIKADLDATLSPHKPVSVEEAQRSFENISSTLPVGLYSFSITAFVDIIILLKRNNLVPQRNPEEVLSQWLSVPDKQISEGDLEMRFGPERWGILKGLLQEQLESLDAKSISPSVRRAKELGLDPAVWKGFLRNAMLYIANDRYHRRQLAEIILAIRNGQVPVEQPIKGDFNERTITLAKLFLGVAREFGSNTLAEFALDLIRDAGQRPSYAIVKDVMLTNAVNRSRHNQQELRSSGEIKMHLKNLLVRYIPRAMKDRQTNFELNLVGKETYMIPYRRRISLSAPNKAAPEAPSGEESTRPQKKGDVSSQNAHEEEFIMQSILPSLGSDYFRGQTTTRENYQSKSIAQVTQNILLPMTPAEEELYKDPSNVDVEKHTKISFSEKRKQQMKVTLEAEHRHSREKCDASPDQTNEKEPCPDTKLNALSPKKGSNTTEKPVKSKAKAPKGKKPASRLQQQVFRG